MALTQEQIKNLKPGDPLIIHGTFLEVLKDGDICIKSSMTLRDRVVNDDRKCAHPSVVSIVKPKHDPCRLFKAGDEVEYRPKDGRANPNLLVGRRYKVSVDEPCDSGIVQVECDGLRHIDTFVAYNNLELVTPVEELNPYYIEENDIEFQVRMKYEDSDCLISVFRFKNIVEGYKQYHDMLPTMTQARECAEAECARLNAEYRKTQTNE